MKRFTTDPLAGFICLLLAACSSLGSRSNPDYDPKQEGRH